MQIFAALGLAAGAAAMATSNSKLPVIHGNGTYFNNLTAGIRPYNNVTSKTNLPLAAASFDCGGRPSFLSSDDCNYISSIGFAGAGAGTGDIWVGSGGGKVFKMHNNANQPIIVVVWNGDGFVSGNAPAVTYSLSAGAEVDISLNNNGQYGGFAAIYNHNNALNNAGQIWQTWGEWSTGDYATFDVSREVDMGGAWLQIYGSNGCNAEWANGFSQCSYTCSNIENSQYNSCYNYGNYWLDNCYSNNNPGAGSSDDLSSGGCTGWGSADVYFL